MIILLLFIHYIIGLNFLKCWWRIILLLFFLTSALLAASPQLLMALSGSYVLFTLLTAGAAYIQDDVFLGVNSDKVSALKGQVARWKRNVQEGTDDHDKAGNCTDYMLL